jgi:hypothetical protein
MAGDKLEQYTKKQAYLKQTTVQTYNPEPIVVRFVPTKETDKKSIGTYATIINTKI